MKSSSSKQILIIGPAWIGDAIMAQVLYKWLKKHDPNVIIDVVAPAHTGALIAQMPEVRQFIPLSIGHGVWNLKARWQLAQSLRATEYDQALVLPNSWKSALIPFLAHIPLRTGWRGEMRYGLLNDVRILDQQALPLMIQRFVGLAMSQNQKVPPRDHLPRPELVVTALSQQTLMAQYQLNHEKPILVLCPGAEFGPAKRWPPEHFAQVARQKLQDGWQVWLLGSPKESDAATVIQAMTQQACINLVGKTDLSQAITLLSLADAVVSNDSGLMHIAAALNRPLVVMYGSSSSRFTPPLAEKVAILSMDLACSPCFARECRFKHLRCLVDLKPQLVLNALQELA